MLIVVLIYLNTENTEDTEYFFNFFVSSVYFVFKFFLEKGLFQLCVFRHIKLEIKVS
jgi:hypothetical protein